MGSYNSHEDLSVLRLDNRQTELWCLIGYESVLRKKKEGQMFLGRGIDIIFIEF